MRNKDHLEALLREVPAPDPGWPDSLLALYLLAYPEKPVALVLEGLREARLLRTTLRAFGVEAVVFQPDEAFAPAEVLLVAREHLDALRRVAGRHRTRRYRIGQTLPLASLVDELLRLNFERVSFVSRPGQFALRGGILDLFLPGERLPLRVELFDDEIVSLRRFDPQSQRSVETLQEVSLPAGASGEAALQVLEPRPWPTLRFEANPPFVGDWRRLKAAVEQARDRGLEVHFFSPMERHHAAYRDLFRVPVHPGGFYNGVTLPDLNLALFSDMEIRERRLRSTPEPADLGERLEDPETLLPGDYVVYPEYGIARFVGLEQVRQGRGTYDCLVLEYRDGRVLVPTYRMQEVYRYTPPGRRPPTLSSLSSGHWQRRLRELEESLWGYAQEIVNLHALKHLRRGFAFPRDDDLVREVELSFPYALTPDQERALEEVKRDMESPWIMDRLVAGEVGFGKTEIALRAAVKAVAAGKQVALLVPTTILALQHYQTFRKRLENLPVRVEMLSRLTPASRVPEILQDLRAGRVDIVIGTHRLLQDDVVFHDLGLFIVDEEHRFGVLQKEKIRRRYLTVDTLRLTATPIPRTLYAALGKIYGLSTIETPPAGRRAVETHVGYYDPDLVREALLRERARGGQVFYIHNRIASLPAIRRKLLGLVPDLRIGIAHGRMREAELEEVFLRFYLGELDVLLSTSIVESGLDFPRANTLIVENAHLFGLAELHQLRGRVGRSTEQAYAYFFVPRRIGDRARARLQALQRYRHLGAALKIALADLEIRGAGNLLGVEQHGHARQVGYHLFFALLEKTLRRMLGEAEDDAAPRVQPAVEAYLPEDYIPEPYVRIAFYRRLSAAESLQELDDLALELRDRFGPLPEPAQNLLDLERLKLWLRSRKTLMAATLEPHHVRLQHKDGREERLRRDLVFRWIQQAGASSKGAS